ncbi:hypothetical protein BGW80DRAFT_511668 [Lactifluus volemus]|nr:hypothetical protein BGW80DRAFT_864585 [Lactifluus volemus]KAH9971159.1 hypothetical protein BGW80DRAFT_511668 [Lactifluus volemus]
MKYIWDYTFFEKLRVDPAGREVLLTEPPMNPRANRQRMPVCQVMFEEYGFFPSSPFLPRLRHQCACVMGYSSESFSAAATLLSAEAVMQWRYLLGGGLAKERRAAPIC